MKFSLKVKRDATPPGRGSIGWRTSLPEALAAAKREGKPVLSLRLLGRLDEEHREIFLEW